jgi:hypothetical protein
MKNLIETAKDLNLDEAKKGKTRVWWYSDKIATQVSPAEVEELLNTARTGYKEITVFESVQYVSADWVINKE